MDFTYDEEQQALREAVRGLVGKAYSDFENRRRTVAEDPGFSEKVWTQLAEMGMLGLPFAEEYGGMGAGPIEVGIVAQELGRVLAPEPFLTSVVLAGGLVAAAGTEEQKTELLGALSAGEMRAGLRARRAGLALAADRVRRDARPPTATRWTLTGVKEPVPNGARADVLVVSAACPTAAPGCSWSTGRSGLTQRTGYPTHDGGRAAKVTFDDTPATPLGVRPRTAPA